MGFVGTVFLFLLMIPVIFVWRYGTLNKQMRKLLEDQALKRGGLVFSSPVPQFLQYPRLEFTFAGQKIIYQPAHAYNNVPAHVKFEAFFDRLKSGEMLVYPRRGLIGLNYLGGNVVKTGIPAFDQFFVVKISGAAFTIETILSPEVRQYFLNQKQYAPEFIGSPQKMTLRLNHVFKTQEEHDEFLNLGLRLLKANVSYA